MLWWLVLLTCGGGAPGEPVCAWRLVPAPISSYAACLRLHAILAPIYEPQDFVCVNERPNDLPLLKRVAPGRQV